MQVFKKQVDTANFYTAYVNIINGILRLSNRDREVFSLILSECKAGDTNDIVTRGVRDAVMRKANMNSPNMSRCIHLLLNKGILVKTENGDTKVSKVLVPTIENGTCSVTYSLNVVEESKIKGDDK